MKLTWRAAALVLLLTTACAPTIRIRHSLERMEKEFHHHAGFMLYDPAKNKVLLNYDGDQYFTPASNTKVFTLLAGLTFLGDSVPALRYRISGDSLVFTGAGDPSLLNPETHSSVAALSLLRDFTGNLFWHPSTSPPTLGPGWSWDDFDAYYQAERTNLPMYGNAVQLKHSNGKVFLNPGLFTDSVTIVPRQAPPKEFRRARGFNRFYVSESDTSTRIVPLVTSVALTRRLLEDTLHRKIGILNRSVVPLNRTCRSIPTDSLYKEMMEVSDNFVADQLLLMAGHAISDTLSDQPAIRRMKQQYFSNLSSPPTWVDGSGLSRYNQFTPRTLVRAWTEIRNRVSSERLFRLINSYPAGSAKPYIHAKTGSLSNNWSFSGILETRRGRTFIFSSMNANFAVPSRKVREEVLKILSKIHELY